SAPKLDKLYSTPLMAWSFKENARDVNNRYQREKKIQEKIKQSRTSVGTHLMTLVECKTKAEELQKLDFLPKLGLCEELDRWILEANEKNKAVEELIEKTEESCKKQKEALPFFKLDSNLQKHLQAYSDAEAHTRIAIAKLEQLKKAKEWDQ